MSENLVQNLIDIYLAAYRAENAEGCAQAFTTDGKLFSPYGPAAEGRVAIAASHSEWFAEKEENKRLDLVEFQIHGNIGHCLLSWSARVQDQDGTRSLASGVSLATLSVENDGVLFHRLALVPDAI